MANGRQLAAALTLTALTVAGKLHAQEPAGKRLAAIVGVAVEEYAKGVDNAGKLVSAVEVEEATGFLREAKSVAARLTSPAAPAVRLIVDSLAVAADRHAPLGDLRAMYRRFSAAMGDEGALDLPSRAIDFARGRRLYEANCATCHGATGAGGPVASTRPATPPPAPIGDSATMHGVTPALMFRILSVGVQATAMVGWAEKLSGDERWDAVSYVTLLRASDAARARGDKLLGAACAASCRDTATAFRFTWLAQQSDDDLAGSLLRTGMVGGVRPTVASAADVPAVVAALRMQVRVEPKAPVAAATTGPVDPRETARTVLRMLDDAVLAHRTGRAADAADLAFDAYIAFEPLETNTRMRDPGLVARLERNFADFHGAMKAGNLSAADANRLAIEQAMPRVLELTVAAPTPWGNFIESFVIILREGFEAILVIGAVVAFLIKTGHKKRVRDVWMGAGTGLVASLLLALVLHTVLAKVPASGEIIEGATLLVAVVVLFSVSYWLLSKVESARWQQFIRERVNAALSHGGSFALAFVAFLAVFREGAETALFFQALVSNNANTLTPVVAGILVGFGALAVIFSLFHRFGVRIPLRPFFAVTSGLLYWMALVFAGKGVKELQEGGVIARTTLPGFPTVEFFGLYPYVETLLAQTTLVLLLLFALWRTMRPRICEPATESGEPIQPEVAARLAELQATARRLQDRVTTLEQEVEHGAPTSTPRQTR